MEYDLKKIEAELAKMSPHSVPENLVARLDEAMCHWHESVPVEEKIISLGESVPVSQSWFQWRSAAAVAFLGAAAAVYFSGNNQPAEHVPVVQQRIIFGDQGGGGVSNATFTPRGARAKVVGYQDRGYIKNSSGQTLRAVAVKVSNQVDYKNANGDHAKVEKPTMEWIFVPVQSD